jgi:general secretion pathway protein D
MKTILLAIVVLAGTGLELSAQTPGLPRYPQSTVPMTSYAAPAAPASSSEEMIPAGYINFQGVDASEVLDVYAKLVGRTLIRGPVPQTSIILKTQTPLTKSEAIEALQAVLSLNGIAVVNIGDKFVKVGPVGDANSWGAEFDDGNATNLPDMGGYVTHIVQLKYVKPSEMIPAIQPFAKLANSILAIDSNGILVLRDNAENVKRMLEMIDKIDVSVPAEFISEVIPIRYAEAADIASALNSLGGSGSSTVSFGSSSAPSAVSGLRGGSTSLNGLGGGNGLNTSGSSYSGGTSSSLGSRTGVGVTSGANGTPTGGSTFQQRLQSIINRASGAGGGASQDQIQVFGQAKIIADQRSNSLLVFASRQDMENIKHVISQLDVLLAQVLIESIIMDVDIGNTLNAGVSVQQNPQQFNNSKVAGGGTINNGNSSFLNTVQTLISNRVTTAYSLPTNSASGLSYFGSIGPTWDIAVQAAESDNNANILQRPRIQTSQAKPAQFFVGQTVPYVNSTYNNSINGGYGGSSYSQLSVGVELDVTPFINPDGLVVMDVAQEIDEISGYTSIDGNNVPNTIKRTLNSEIAVRNRDTVILGGFIRSQKSHATAGVPVLMNIPVLGWLFRSTDNQKDRTELMVLMRPTVLKTPAIAAAETVREGQRLPGVSAAAYDYANDERKLIDVERKKELRGNTNAAAVDGFPGFFNMTTNAVETPVPADDSGAAAPPDANATIPPISDQDKARAALQEKMNELDAQQAAPGQSQNPQ